MDVVNILSCISSIMCSLLKIVSWVLYVPSAILSRHFFCGKKRAKENTLPRISISFIKADYMDYADIIY